MKKRTLCLLLIPLFILLSCLPGLISRSAFEHFTDTYFTQVMTANTLHLHYSLAHPENFGIPSYEISLPPYEAGSELSGGAYLSERVSQLSTLLRLPVSASQRQSARLLLWDLKSSLALADFPYYEEPLSPVSGIQSQLPVLLAEYTLQSRKDIEEYLALLKLAGPYLESLLIYEQEKSAAGLSQPRSSLLKAAEQCDTIVANCYAGSDISSHFLQVSFERRLAALSPDVLPDLESLAEYERLHKTLLKNSLFPSYARLSAGLKSLSETAPASPQSLSALPGGKAYYAHLLTAETGSPRSPEAVRILLQDRLAMEKDTIRRLLSDYPGCRAALEAGTYHDLPISDPSVMLKDLKKRMAGEFPALSSQVQARIMYAPAELQDYLAPAFYLTAPIDNTDTNVIYINLKDGASGLELYTTIAHEGFPGHLYQNAYSASHLLSLKDSRLRQLCGTGGYVEGWAVYTELRAYDYAAELLLESSHSKEDSVGAANPRVQSAQGNPHAEDSRAEEAANPRAQSAQDSPHAGDSRAADAVCIEIEKHTHSMRLCLYALLDLMIHYDGASEEDVLAFLSPYGIKDSSRVAAIYEYICSAPCNYPKYYLGYLEILELKERARELWGDSYSELAFHTFYLEEGPADFENLTESLLDSSAPAEHSAQLLRF